MAPDGRSRPAAGPRRAAPARGSACAVGVGELLAAHRALAAVDAGSREQAFFALRATLCSSRADHERFALAFAAVFGAAERPEAQDPLEALGTIARAALPRVAVPERRRRRSPQLDAVPAAWSEEELLRATDFADYTDAERAAALALLARLARRGPSRLSRRTRPARHARPPPRPARHHARVAAPGRRAARAALARADAAPAPARADPRRVGLDGAVRADAAPVRAGVRRGPRAGRGVRVRHAADAAHARARRPRPGPRARARRRARDRLVRRHADRRLARDAQPRARPPDRARRVRRPALGRLGPRRPGRARRRARPPAPHGAPAGVAQPARRRSALRAAHARDARPPCRTSTACCRGIPSRPWSSSRI